MDIEGLRTPKKLTLEDLLSPTPVQGIGYERFTQKEIEDLDALLSGLGIRLDDSLMEGLQGSELASIMEYVRAPVGSPERAKKKVEIAAAIQRLKHNA